MVLLESEEELNIWPNLNLGLPLSPKEEEEIAEWELEDVELWREDKRGVEEDVEDLVEVEEDVEVDVEEEDLVEAEEDVETGAEEDLVEAEEDADVEEDLAEAVETICFLKLKSTQWLLMSITLNIFRMKNLIECIQMEELLVDLIQTIAHMNILLSSVTAITKNGLTNLIIKCTN